MGKIEVWLYASLAKYGGDKAEGTFAHLYVEMPDGAIMQDLLDILGLPPEEKGITFINSVLSDMPGLAADRQCTLKDGDRVGIFPTVHVWPYQYRFGAKMTPELERVLREREGGGMHHNYS